jgi:ComF family protein
MNPGSPYNWHTRFVKPGLFLIEKMWPAECFICQTEGSWLCDTCQKQLITIKAPTCPFCNRLSEKGQTCSRCRSRYALTGNRALWYYKEPLKTVIGRFKYQGVTAIVDTFVPKLAEIAQQFPHQPEIITSVPSAPHKWRERGYNQSALLAKATAQQLNIPYQDLLIRQPKSLAQVGLTRVERLANVTQQFQPKIPLNNQSILIIDDVITTGATLNACAVTLKQAGSGPVWAITLAKD